MPGPTAPPHHPPWAGSARVGAGNGTPPLWDRACRVGTAALGIPSAPGPACEPRSPGSPRQAGRSVAGDVGSPQTVLPSSGTAQRPPRVHPAPVLGPAQPGSVAAAAGLGPGHRRGLGSG